MSHPAFDGGGWIYTFNVNLYFLVIYKTHCFGKLGSNTNSNFYSNLSFPLALKSKETCCTGKCSRFPYKACAKIQVQIHSSRKLMDAISTRETNKCSIWIIMKIMIREKKKKRTSLFLGMFWECQWLISLSQGQPDEKKKDIFQCKIRELLLF